MIKLLLLLFYFLIDIRIVSFIVSCFIVLGILCYFVIRLFKIDDFGLPFKDGFGSIDETQIASLNIIVIPVLNLISRFFILFQDEFFNVLALRSSLH